MFDVSTPEDIRKAAEQISTLRTDLWTKDLGALDELAQEHYHEALVFLTAAANMMRLARLHQMRALIARQTGR